MKIILFLITLTSAIFASPAFKGNMQFKQTDGTKFEAQLKGDEWFNWIEDKKSHIIKYNNHSKNFEYARVKQQNGELDLVPSGAKVGARLSTYAKDESKIDQKLLQTIWKQKRKKASQFMHR